MWTLNSSLWSDLLSATHRIVVVYELALDAVTLRYAPQNLTWSSNTYTELAISQRPIRERIDRLGQECSVTFSNVDNTLRGYLEPTDQLTGRTMTIRLLTRDGTDTLNTYSKILMQGEMERPRRITSSEFEIKVVDPINAAGVALPRRKTAHYCGWDYANEGAFDGSGHCPYQNTTLANGAGTDSTALTVDDGTNLNDGDEILIGSMDQSDKVAISSGGGTTSITLAAARTWLDNDPVRLATCGREISDCTQRAQTHRFAGFAALSFVTRTRYKLRGNSEQYGADDVALYEGDRFKF